MTQVAELQRELQELKTPKPIIYCSFCGKSQYEVQQIIAGPAVFICDECVVLCGQIVEEKSKPPRASNAMFAAADHARSAWLSKDENDQIGALSAALDAALAVHKQEQERSKA